MDTRLSLIDCGLRLVETDVEGARAYPTAVDDIYEEKLHAVLVRSVFERDWMAEVERRLEKIASILPWNPSENPDPKGRAGHVLGTIMAPTDLRPKGPDLPAYLDDASRARSCLKRLFAGGPDFDATVRESLGRLAGGRPLKVPVAPDGRPYAHATLRVMPEGRGTPLHNDMIRGIEAYQQLGRITNPRTQLSFYVPLTRPEAGGELIIYNLKWGQTELPLDKDGRLDRHAIERYPSITVVPGVGDMILFDAGRLFHLVRPTEGPTPRRTIGGFAGLSVDRSVMYYWS